MAEAFIPIAMLLGGAVGGVIIIAREAKREDEESKGEEVPKIVIKREGIREKILREGDERHRKYMETLEKMREKLREREKILENQFIDEYPELSLQERVDLSRKLLRVKAEW